MSKLYPLITICFILCLLLLQVKVSAQSTESATVDSLELDNIVITASKIPQARRETTKPVQIIDRAEIEKNTGRNLSQILNQQSGIRVNDSFGAPSNGRILYMQGAAATNTLILVDGLAISDPSGTGGLFDLRLLSTENIERIEIIKGSQSTLYGTDAIAGVINIITRKGGDDSINGNGQFSYGSYDTFNGSLGVNGAVTQGVRYNVSYSRESAEGISAAENPGSEGSFDKDGFNNDSFFGRIDITPVENLTISPFLQYSSYDGDYDGGAFSDAENEFTLKMFSPRLQVEYNAERARVNAEYNYTRTERSFVNSFGENEFEGRFHNADLFGNYSLTDYVQVLAGLNYQGFSIPAAEGGSSRNASIISPYATVYLNDAAGFSAELGYRLNNHTEYGSNSTFSVAPSYKLAENVKLFGSVTTGFKAPTLDELFGQFGANPDLDPQRSLYMNAGVEAYLLDQSLKFSAQYFNREIDDLIIYATAGFVNRDRQNDQGIELSGDWIVNSNLTLGGWYNNLDGEITQEGENGSVTESNLIRRPENSFGFRADVQPLEHLTIRLNGEYNSERSELYFNPNNNFAAEDVTLDAYTLVNVYAEYSLLDQRLTLFGDVQNLFNTDFTEVYGYNTIGTSLKAGVKVNF
ncbi:TonB-dependent receptor plug domain-containing protein [Rhodohalobacter sp. 8-1]|uniref:TonB-dependent receptor plug domain-containing protein n=1 Tax=Rhodohalobacter sp. 8-1 TaxID=3131972 RepID=UPI0030ECDDA1